MNDQGSLTVQLGRVTAKNYEEYRLMKKGLKIFRDLKRLNAMNALHDTYSVQDLATVDGVERGLQEIHGEPRDPMGLVASFCLGMGASMVSFQNGVCGIRTT